MPLPSLVLTLAIGAADFDAAFSDGGATAAAAHFDNTAEGVARFDDWLARNRRAAPQPVAGALRTCVAVLRWAPRTAYDSPAMVRMQTGNDPVMMWNARHIEALFPAPPGAASIAEAMLPACRRESASDPTAAKPPPARS